MLELVGRKNDVPAADALAAGGPLFPAGVEQRFSRRRRRRQKDWSDLHPRDEHGRFSDIAGGDLELSGGASGRLAESLREHGGFTYSAFLKEVPRHGKVLSIHPKREKVIAGRVTPEQLRAYHEKNKDLLGERRNYIGGWKDKATGKTHLDVSAIVSTAAEAKALATAHNQIAYWDLDEGKEVRLKERRVRKGLEDGRAPEGADRRGLSAHGGLPEWRGRVRGDEAGRKAVERLRTKQRIADILTDDNLWHELGKYAMKHALPVFHELFLGGMDAALRIAQHRGAVKDWSEDQHPRDEHGKFAAGEGDSGNPSYEAVKRSDALEKDLPGGLTVDHSTEADTDVRIYVTTDPTNLKSAFAAEGKYIAADSWMAHGNIMRAVGAWGDQSTRTFEEAEKFMYDKGYARVQFGDTPPSDDPSGPRPVGLSGTATAIKATANDMINKGLPPHTWTYADTIVNGALVDGKRAMLSEIAGRGGGSQYARIQNDPSYKDFDEAAHPRDERGKFAGDGGDAREGVHALSKAEAVANMTKAGFTSSYEMPEGVSFLDTDKGSYYAKAGADSHPKLAAAAGFWDNDTSLPLDKRIERIDAGERALDESGLVSIHYTPGRDGEIDVTARDMERIEAAAEVIAETKPDETLYYSARPGGTFSPATTAAKLAAHGVPRSEYARIQGNPAYKQDEPRDLSLEQRLAQRAAVEAGRAANEWWERLQGTVRQQLESLLGASTFEEGSALDLGATLEGVAALFGPDRAERIAVTETTRVMGQAANATYDELGIELWDWRTAEDSLVDAVCEDMRDGGPYMIDEVFEPAHVNCRCWPVPVLGQAKDFAEEQHPRDERGRFASSDNADTSAGNFLMQVLRPRRGRGRGVGFERVSPGEAANQEEQRMSGTAPEYHSRRGKLAAWDYARSRVMKEFTLVGRRDFDEGAHPRDEHGRFANADSDSALGASVTVRLPPSDVITEKRDPAQVTHSDKPNPDPLKSPTFEAAIDKDLAELSTRGGGPEEGMLLGPDGTEAAHEMGKPPTEDDLAEGTLGSVEWKPEDVEKSRYGVCMHSHPTDWAQSPQDIVFSAMAQHAASIVVHGDHAWVVRPNKVDADGHPDWHIDKIRPATDMIIQRAEDSAKRWARHTESGIEGKTIATLLTEDPDGLSDEERAARDAADTVWNDNYTDHMMKGFAKEGDLTYREIPRYQQLKMPVRVSRARKAADGDMISYPILDAWKVPVEERQRIAREMWERLGSKEFDETQHPRDEHGRFASDGGGEGGDSAAGGEHHDKLNYIPRGPFHTVATATEALEAIQRGEYVQLPPDQVGTLLEKMADIARDAEAKGEKAPKYDLCQVEVPDTNIFCEESKGIARADMPQIDDKPAFKKYLADNGLRFTDETVNAEHLKATQRELDGVTVGSMVEEAKAGAFDPRSERIFVSSDNFVLDGHHRWAATVGLDFAQDNKPGDLTIDVTRVNLPIMALLPVANRFDEITGTAKRGIGADTMTPEQFMALQRGGKAARFLMWLQGRRDWDESKHPRDHGRFSEAEGGDDASLYASGDAAGGRTADEEKARVHEWLSRHEIPQDAAGRYLFYHGTPNRSATAIARDGLAAGSLLAEDADSAVHFAARDRDLKPAQVTLLRVAVEPHEIRVGQWAQLRKPLPADRASKTKDWDEGAHPRDEHGRFAGDGSTDTGSQTGAGVGHESHSPPLINALSTGVPQGGFTNDAEAKAYMKEHYPNLAYDMSAKADRLNTAGEVLGRDAVDPHIRDDIIRGLDKMASEYPDVVAKMTYLDAQPQTGSWWAISTDEAERQGRGISFNLKFATDRVGFSDTLGNSVAAGFHPPGCDTVQSVMVHEFGHQVYDYMLTSNRGTLGNPSPPERAGGQLIGHLDYEFNQLKGDPSPYQFPSRYAETNDREAFAESFAAHYCSPKVTDPAGYGHESLYETDVWKAVKGFFQK